MSTKIKTYEEIFSLLLSYKQEKKKVVQCHGVFDLLHPGHIRHLREAKKQGDVLIVTLTPDRFVNKGPGRPVFHQELRMESIAALDCVDFVVLNDSPDAVSSISRIKPDIYVKGVEYKEEEKDVTQKITEERRSVEAHKGTIYFTDDIVFSSSSLLNQFFDPMPKGVQKFLRTIKGKYTLGQLIEKVEAFSEIKVLVVGDAILDVYQYVDPLGQAGKGIHMVASCREKEQFLGGSLILANHLAEFTPNVDLVTGLGFSCPYESWIREKLNPKVKSHFLSTTQKETLIKKRYVLKEGATLSKLFETYSCNAELLEKEKRENLEDLLTSLSEKADLVLVCDFGNGFLSPSVAEKISKLPSFLAINTQINSGNRGLHAISRYERANFISLNEPEARLAFHDRYSPLDFLIEDILSKMQANYIAITRGVQGVICKSANSANGQEIPALNDRAVDRIGAGDSFFALSSLAAFKNLPVELVGFFGAIAAALDVQIVGNRDPVRKSQFLKYLTRLLK